MIGARSKGAGRSFSRCEDASAAVEFAFIAPLLLTLLVVGVDVGRYVQATAQMTQMANTMAQLVASRSAASGAAVTVSDNEILYILQSSFVIYPYLLKDSSLKNVDFFNDINIVISSVSFMPGPAGCSGSACTVYTPKVVWSSPMGSSTTRSCTAAPTQVPSNAAPSVTTLPLDVYPSAGTGTAGTPTGNIVVVDISYSYTSIWRMSSALPISLPRIRRSVYVAPRYTLPTQNGITYTGKTTFTSMCS